MILYTQFAVYQRKGLQIMVERFDRELGYGKPEFSVNQGMALVVTIVLMAIVAAGAFVKFAVL